MSVDTRIFDAYLECALWASGEEFDGRTIFEFSKSARDSARQELEDFIAAAGDLLDEWEPSQIGRDFWLTRNRHGAGFWDRGLPNSQALTALAHSYGERELYVGDDDKLHFA